MKYKVRTLDTYKKLNIKDEELNYIPEPGKELIVTKERLNKLLGANEHHAIFVELIEGQIETATEYKKNINKKSDKNVEKRPLQK